MTKVLAVLAALSIGVFLIGCADEGANAPIEGEVKTAPEGAARPEGKAAPPEVDPNL